MTDEVTTAIGILAERATLLRVEAEGVADDLRNLEKQAAAKRIEVADLLRKADECAKAIERLRQSSPATSLNIMNQNINLPQAMPKQSFTF